MKKPVKVTLIALASLLAVLLAGLVLVPILFKDQIVERLGTELNARLDATVTFSDVDVSLLSTFPTLTAKITDLGITGKDEFTGIALLSAKSIGAGVDLPALIMDGAIEVVSIEVVQPEVHVLVHADGKANYEIFREQEETSDESTGTLAFEIKRYRISKGSIRYETPDLSIVIAGLEHDGRAIIAGSTHELSSETTLDGLTARAGRTTYLKEAKTSVSLDALVDTERKQLTLRALRAAVNQLALDASGSVGWAGPGIDLDLQVASKPGLPIKALISAIPNAYAADFAGLKASGAFSLAVRIQGQLGPDDNDIPSFTATATVRDGTLKYPDLPMGISEINLDAKLAHPGGHLDRVRIDVPKYGIVAGKSHASGHLAVSRPLSQPQIDLALDGRFDLAEVARAYPISGIEAIEGLVAAIIELKTKGDQIEKLTGGITVTDLLYRAADTPPVRIRSARVELAPESTRIVELEIQVAESDAKLTGSASPLTTLLMEDQVITANLQLTSKQLRVEDFLSSGEPETTEQTSPFVLPDGVDAKLQFDVGKLTYGDLILDNFKGKGRLRNRTLVLEGVRADALGGAMTLDGTVATPVDGAPTFDIAFDVNKVRFADAFKQLPSMRAYAPIAEFLDGRFSTNLKASGILGQDLSPKLNSIDASGLVAAVQSKLHSDFKPLAVLSDAIPSIPKPLDIASFRTRFKIEDGAVRVTPFPVQVRGITMEVSGSHGLDQEMKYQVASEIPLDKLSSKLAKEAQMLKIDLSKAKAVGVRANLTGSMNAPRVSVDLDSSTLRGVVANAVSAELEAQKARAMQELTEQTQRLIEEAEKRAAQIRSEAAKAAERARKEGYARADQAEQKAANNPLTAIAAKEGAKRLRSETDKRANQLIAEADKRADQVVAEARKRALQTLTEAAKRGDQATEAVEKQTDKAR